MNPFAAAIRARRLELGMSQEELAEALGDSVAFIRRFEAGKVGFPLERLPELALSLNLDTTTLCRQALAQQAPMFYACLVGKIAQLEIDGMPPRDFGDRLLVEVREEDSFWITQLDMADSTTRRCVREVVEHLLKVPAVEAN